MSVFKVRYKVGFGRRQAKPAKRKARSRPNPPSRVASLLALAHYVERLVEGGTLKDYADTTRLLGMTRARMTQVINLLNLSPAIQEAVLLGDLKVSERQLRAPAREILWKTQAAQCSAGGD